MLKTQTQVVSIQRLGCLVKQATFLNALACCFPSKILSSLSQRNSIHFLFELLEDEFNSVQVRAFKFNPTVAEYQEVDLIQFVFFGNLIWFEARLKFNSKRLVAYVFKASEIELSIFSIWVSAYQDQQKQKNKLLHQVLFWK